MRISDWSADVCSSDLVAIVQPRPQVGALAGEQAGVQAAAGGHARAVTIAAERRADRTDEADLAGAVVEAVARGHLAAVVGVERVQRPACVDAVAQLRCWHHSRGVPAVAGAHVHVFDDAHDVAATAEMFAPRHTLAAVATPTDDAVALESPTPPI